MSEENIVVSDSIQVAPFRSISEFLLDKARYQLPTFNDLSKWNFRITTNLLYYQSNYFVVALIFILISSFVHMKEVVVGLSAIAAVLGALGFSLSKNEQFVRIRSNYPYAVVLLMGMSGYYFIYSLPAVITLLFTLLLPLLLIGIHSSLRLRNFSAKVNAKMEQLRLNQTVMGKILDSVGAVQHFG
ncbi:PRA1 family protein [Aphelenchoides bicaudatus]|nr:PRA1 family protein [Aphelenchoides bicaudatus]